MRAAVRGFGTLMCVGALSMSAACSEKADTASSISASDEALITKARAIVSAVEEARWQDARKDFDATMREGLPSSKLAVSWAAYVKEFGDLESMGDAEVVDSGVYKVVNIELDLSKREGEARVTFDEKGKVAGLFFLKTGVPVPSLPSS